MQPGFRLAPSRRTDRIERTMIFDNLKKLWQDWRKIPHWSFTTGGAEGIDAMYRECEKAKISIDCEQFIFSTDATGTKFLELFLEKLKAGVKVRLLLDHVGSVGLYASDWPGRLRDAGAEVRFFNVVSPWRARNFTAWYFRTHRKILVVDGKTAHMGGLGIREDMRSWRDTNMSITGETVPELQQTFDRMWQQAEKKVFFRFKKFRTYIKGFRVVVNAPRYRGRHIYWSFIHEIRAAEKSISLTTPYFVPDRRFMRVIRLAALRKVDVRLLLPQRLTNRWIDRLVDIAAQSHFTALLKRGVRIFQYPNGFLHAKTMVVDGKWATVGSFNLDYLSFLWNYETNIESTNESFVGELAGHFEKDILESRELTLAEWQARPFYRKLFEALTYPFRSFL